ncbi:MAG: hypothetical protein IJG88_00705 [Eggerthellaceae bacterium]|nr:hypothetical protein [Eggerthellaceae bacterium]
MSCKYCDGVECLASICEIEVARDTLVYIGRSNGKPVLIIEQDCGSVNMMTEEIISFCPKCGEDLRARLMEAAAIADTPIAALAC